MRWGHEIVRACLAGTVMHFAIVVACSGSVYTPPLELTAAGGSGETAPLDDGASMGGASSALSGGVGGVQSEPSMMMPVAEAQAAESGTRLKARWYVAEDGARQWAFNWFDRERNEECSFQRAADGVLRCIPAGVVLTTYYSDPDCTQRVVASYASLDCQGNPPRYGFEYETVDCESRIVVIALGQVLQQEIFHALVNDSCVESTPTPGYVYRRPGNEVSPTSFVAAQLHTEG